MKAQSEDLPFGLPKADQHHPTSKRTFMKVDDKDNKSEGEVEMLAGKGKAADKPGPSGASQPRAKCLCFSGQPEVPEEGSPTASKDNCFEFRCMTLITWNWSTCSSLFPSL